MISNPAIPNPMIRRVVRSNFVSSNGSPAHYISLPRSCDLETPELCAPFGSGGALHRHGLFGSRHWRSRDFRLLRLSGFAIAGLMLLRHFHFPSSPRSKTSRKSAMPTRLFVIANSQAAGRFTGGLIENASLVRAPSWRQRPGLSARQEQRRLKKTYGDILVHDEVILGPSKRGSQGRRACARAWRQKVAPACFSEQD